jgi:hypothetical protein
MFLDLEGAIALVYDDDEPCVATRDPWDRLARPLSIFVGLSHQQAGSRSLCSQWARLQSAVNRRECDRGAVVAAGPGQPTPRLATMASRQRLEPARPLCRPGSSPADVATPEADEAGRGQDGRDRHEREERRERQVTAGKPRDVSEG